MAGLSTIAHRQLPGGFFPSQKFVNVIQSTYRQLDQVVFAYQQLYITLRMGGESALRLMNSAGRLLP
jgi:hypothetical protein